MTDSPLRPRLLEHLRKPLERRLAHPKVTEIVPHLAQLASTLRFVTLARRPNRFDRAQLNAIQLHCHIVTHAHRPRRSPVTIAWRLLSQPRFRSPNLTPCSCSRTRPATCRCYFSIIAFSSSDGHRSADLEV